MFEQLAKRRDVPLPVAQVIDEAAHGFGSRYPECPIERLVRRLHSKVAVKNEHGLPYRFHDVLGIFECRLDHPFGLAPLGDVAEYQDHADDVAVGASDRSRTIVDRPLRAAFPNQQGVICQADNVAFSERLRDGVLHLPACAFVDDLKHRLQGQPGRLRARPAGHCLSDRVEQGDPPFCVGGDDGIADGLERDPQRLLLSSQGSF